MKWIKDILAKHTDENGVLNLEAAESELNAEANKNVIPKDQYNSKVEELKQANDTLDTLKKDHKGVEDLQKTISEHEGTIEKLQAEKADQAKEFALKTAFTTAGAKDVDYFVDKLKTESELSEDGSLKGIEDKIKEFQTQRPYLFETADNKDKKPGDDGFRIQDTSLDSGSPTPALTKKEIYEKYPNDKEKRIELIQKLEKE